MTIQARDVKMEKLRFNRVRLSSLVLCLVSWALRSEAVQLSGHESRVSGRWQEVWENADGGTLTRSGLFGQEGTGSGMIFWQEASAPHGWGWTEGAVGPFSLWLTAGSAAWLLPMADGSMGSLPGTAMTVAAESRTRFLVNAPSLSFTLQAEAYWNYHAHEQDMSLVVRDLTLDEVLLRWQLAEQPVSVFSANYQFSVNPAHEYELVLSGWVNAWDAKDASLRLWVGWDVPGGEIRIARVPDGGSAAVLLLLAMGGLWTLGRLWARSSF